MKYLHYFETETKFNTERKNNYIEPWVSYTEEVKSLAYNKPPITYNVVDLGLPSGTLWCDRNVGASSPEEYGDYYAWGEIVPNKATYTYQNYRFYSYGKYNSTDGKKALDPEDDAAHVVIGGEWHMPSGTQLKELINNTTSIWTTDYNGMGRVGMIVTSKINANSIFFPAAGISADGACDVGIRFSAWSSEKPRFEDYGATTLIGNGNGMEHFSDEDRWHGSSVRGVIG